LKYTDHKGNNKNRAIEQWKNRTIEQWKNGKIEEFKIVKLFYELFLFLD
jgi:hypothetical protein